MWPFSSHPRSHDGCSRPHFRHGGSCLVDISTKPVDRATLVPLLSPLSRGQWKQPSCSRILQARETDPRYCTYLTDHRDHGVLEREIIFGSHGRAERCHVRGTEGRVPAPYEAHVSTVVTSTCHTTLAYCSSCSNPPASKPQLFARPVQACAMTKLECCSARFPHSRLPGLCLS